MNDIKIIEAKVKELIALDYDIDEIIGEIYNGYIFGKYSSHVHFMPQEIYDFVLSLQDSKLEAKMINRADCDILQTKAPVSLKKDKVK